MQEGEKMVVIGYFTARERQMAPSEEEWGESMRQITSVKGKNGGFVFGQPK